MPSPYSHSKDRNLKWWGVRLATALARRLSGKEGTGTDPAPMGTRFPSEHVQIEHLCRNAVQDFLLVVHVCVTRKPLEGLPGIAGINIALPFASERRGHTGERQSFVSQPSR